MRRKVILDYERKRGEKGKEAKKESLGYGKEREERRKGRSWSKGRLGYERGGKEER